MNNKWLYILLLCFLPGFTRAVTLPCKIRRICIDKITNNITVYFNPVQDACGSFVRYELWGRESPANIFQFLTSASSIGVNNINYALPNRKNWEFQIYCLYACNGTDTLFSASEFIDYSPPALLDPDSVSVDFITQRLQIGWPKAPESDVMTYSLFKVDPSGNNQYLYAQQTSPFLFPLSDFDPSSADNRVALAVRDSCDNEGLVSNRHSPVFLSISSTKNSNYVCTKNIVLDWTGYVGWTVSKYEIWVKSNKTGLWSLGGSVNGGTLTFTYNFPDYDDTYTFLIRAYKIASSITSSSNVLSFTTTSIQKPSYLYIGHVSVGPNNDYIEITSYWEKNTTLFQSVDLQRRPMGGSTWNTIHTYNISESNSKYLDYGVTPSTLSYEYQLVLKNKCGLNHDTSETHNSMLMQRGGYYFGWNGYLGDWTTQSSYLLDKENRSFTWNKTLVGANSYMLNDTANAKCYRLITYKLNNGKPVDSSFSNTLCLFVKDTTLIPGGFSPEGNNKLFYIVNPNIKRGEASLKIYNRWGEKLWEGDALVGWDGRDKNGNIYPYGMYVYLISIKRTLKSEAYKGTLFLLR